MNNQSANALTTTRRAFSRYGIQVDPSLLQDDQERRHQKPVGRPGSSRRSGRTSNNNSAPARRVTPSTWSPSAANSLSTARERHRELQEATVDVRNRYCFFWSPCCVRRKLLSGVGINCDRRLCRRGGSSRSSR